MSELDPISLHEGVSSILFGVSKDEVINLLGTEYEEVLDDEGNLRISYPTLGLEFSFWVDDNDRLGVISTSRKFSTLLGENLIGCTKSEVGTFIKIYLKCPITELDGCIHEDGEVQEWIDVDSRDLSFWFLNHSLYQIDWTCAWVDGDTP